MSENKVTIHDLRASGYCVTGIKTHYYGLNLDVSFRDFVRHGYDLDKARLIDDARVQAAVKKAEERIAAEKGGK